MGGRPTKQGIDYFPLDTSFDEKVELFLAEKESLGLAVLVTIWQLIYKDEGYYVINNPDLLLRIKLRVSGDINAIDDCINASLRRNLFSQEMHNEFGILTSAAIQRRFFNAASKKKEVRFFHQLMLISIDSYINLIDSGIYSIDSTGKGIKGKEEGKEELKGEEKKINSKIKEKEIQKEKESLGNLFCPSPSDLDDSHKKKKDTPKFECATPEKLISLFNVIPGIKKTLTLNKSTITTINARIKENPSMEWWIDLAERLIAPSDWLCGRKADFCASLTWICGPKNMGKILAGNYVNNNFMEQTKEFRNAEITKRTITSLKERMTDNGIHAGAKDGDHRTIRIIGLDVGCPIGGKTGLALPSPPGGSTGPLHPGGDQEYD